MFPRLFTFIYALSVHGWQITAAESLGANTVSAQKWSKLNETVGGKLYSALPVSAPCFHVVNGKNVSVDAKACQVVQDGYTSPAFRAPNFGAYMLPQWETCQAKSQQCLLDVSNVSNPHAWEDFTCQQGSVPPHYVDVRAASDVQAVYKFSKETGVPIVIKNSGHDYKGRSSMQGALGIWVHNINNLTHNPKFKPEKCSATYNVVNIGAGVGFQTIYEFAEANNITYIGGYHQTIAASGGWVQGGGHSILSPVYGLGVDRVVQFKVVTPDGVYRVANECQNTDLFWALRGGGGSTFGVVLETSQRVEPQMRIVAASIKFPQTATNAAPWLKLVVDNALKWGKQGWGGHIGAVNLINVTPLLTLAQAKDSLKDVADYARSQNGTVVIEEFPSWYQFFAKYVPAAQSAVGTENILGTRLMPSSLFNSTPGKKAVYQALVNMLPYANPYIVVGTPFLYKATPSATSVTPAWYNSLWHLGFHDGWTFDSTLSDIKTAYNVVKNVTQTFRDISPGSGAYFNEGDVYEPDHENSFWGHNYAKLLAIKIKYDPDHLLDCWQCVGTRGTSDKRFSCYIDL